MFEPKRLFYQTLRKRQLEYRARMAVGEAAMQEVWHERTQLYTLSAEGLQIPELIEETVVFIDELFPAIALWGEWTSWVNMLEIAVADNGALPNASFLLRKWLAYCYERNHNFVDADALLTPLYMSEEAEKSPHFPMLLHRFASIKMGMGDLQQAQRLVGESFTLLKKRGTTNHQSALLHNLRGQVALRQQKRQAAADAFAEAIRLWELTHWPTNVARAQLNLGVTFFHLNQLEEARDCFLRCEEIAQQHENLIDLISAINNLATIYFKQADYLQAEQTLRRGVEASQMRKGIEPIRASLQHNLGNTLLQLQRFDEAAIYLKSAQQKWTLLANVGEEAKTTETLGEVAEAIADYDHAINYYAIAVDLAKRTIPPNQPLISRCEVAILRCRAQVLNS